MTAIVVSGTIIGKNVPVAKNGIQAAIIENNGKYEYRKFIIASLTPPLIPP
jgi:hypothetical protein